MGSVGAGTGWPNAMAVDAMSLSQKRPDTEWDVSARIRQIPDRGKCTNGWGSPLGHRHLVRIGAEHLLRPGAQQAGCLVQAPHGYFLPKDAQSAEQGW